MMTELYEFRIIVFVEEQDPTNARGNQKERFQEIIGDIASALDNTNTQTRILEVKKL